MLTDTYANTCPIQLSKAVQSRVLSGDSRQGMQREDGVREYVFFSLNKLWEYIMA